jgi:hypothetical protein
MADLNIRDVDPELIKELKQAALDAGWSMKELCIHRLKGVTYGEIRRKESPQMIIEKPKKTEREKPSPKIAREPEKASEIPKPEAKPAKLGKCPRCEGQTIPWGSMRRCMNCNQNWPM